MQMTKLQFDDNTARYIIDGNRVSRAKYEEIQLIHRMAERHADNFLTERREGYFRHSYSVRD